MPLPDTRHTAPSARQAGLASVTDAQAPQADKKDAATSSLVGVLATSFTTVFLAELGDKTQLATLMLSAQSGQPLLVFAGAAAALICSSLMGVLLGRWLSRRLDPERLERMAGVLMLILAVWIGWDSFTALWFDPGAETLAGAALSAQGQGGLALLGSSFVTVFVAELGDKTQLATVAISGTSDRPVMVFFGSATALVLASLLGAAAGGSLAAVIPAPWLKLVAAVGFVWIGARLLLAPRAQARGN